MNRGIRVIIGIAIGLFSLFSYFTSQQYNEVTGENQYVSLSPEQEIALGQRSAPQIIQEYGGLAPNEQLQRQIDQIGERLVAQSIAADTPWQFEFHVLDDPQTVNAFALPGGPVFVTTAMINQLETNDNDGYEEEVAGVIAHEIVHVLARHGAQRLAKSELTNGLVGAVAVASDDASAAQASAVIGQLINMQYSREDELESDTLGVCLMIDANYDPAELADVMRVLEEASGGSSPPEFLSTHPSPDNRVEEIQQAIDNADSQCPS